MDLIKQSFQRIFSGRISPQLWLVSILANVFGISAITLIDRDVVTETAPLLYGALVILLVVAAVMIFVALWRITRALGDATDEDLGGVGPWIGWTIVAFLPVSLVFGLLEYHYEISSNWLLTAILFSVGLSLSVPLLVHADGKAVQAIGPSLPDIHNYWSKNYLRLFGAYLAVSLPLLIASDGLDAIDTTNALGAIVLSIASAAISFVSGIICAGITVSAYREAESATK
jgi:hypothetical protein